MYIYDKPIKYKKSKIKRDFLLCIYSIYIWVFCFITGFKPNKKKLKSKLKFKKMPTKNKRKKKNGKVKIVHSYEKHFLPVAMPTYVHVLESTICACTYDTLYCIQYLN